MFSRLRRPVFPDHIVLPLSGGEIAVRLRPDPRARRYLLRLPHDQSGPVLTIPKGGSLSTAQRFAEKHAGWLEEKLAALPQTTPFTAGSVVPVRGVLHRIEPSGRLRGLVTAELDADGHAVLSVPGAAEHTGRKVADWLKRQARADIEAAVARHTATLGVKAAAISLRDTRSRWGSCASNGRLSFSWRLILAPPEILDYVAAHEVAHLREMNHSDRFWALCRQLAPHTPKARQWLKDEGGKLHLFG
ncbi:MULTISPECIES: M48 family metallopeptidase [unclassified Pannonibacter]|uniref:M48 family metallopeptidase n=1 Tax=unclassified Pannonibacter TaxID=2627228 RepID=UPI001644CB7E|nr:MULTISPECIES: SprT family zinc-dependent metalloprotease [unclassified Pannonibacter]